MQVDVLGHRVLVKPDPVEEVTAGGIVMVRDTKRERMATQVGTVLQIGPTAWQDFGGTRWALPGDRVMFAKYAGKLIEHPETKEDVFILNDEDILMRVTEEPKNG